MNHVFVDFENVRHVDAAVVGAKQTKLDTALVHNRIQAGATGSNLGEESRKKHVAFFHREV